MTRSTKISLFTIVAFIIVLLMIGSSVKAHSNECERKSHKYCPTPTHIITSTPVSTSIASRTPMPCYMPVCKIGYMCVQMCQHPPTVTPIRIPTQRTGYHKPICFFYKQGGWICQ